MSWNTNWIAYQLNAGAATAASALLLYVAHVDQMASESIIITATSFAIP